MSTFPQYLNICIHWWRSYDTFESSREASKWTLSWDCFVKLVLPWSTVHSECIVIKQSPHWPTTTIKILFTQTSVNNSIILNNIITNTSALKYLNTWIWMLPPALLYCLCVKYFFVLTRWRNDCMQNLGKVSWILKASVLMFVINHSTLGYHNFKSRFKLNWCTDERVLVGKFSSCIPSFPHRLELSVWLNPDSPVESKRLRFPIIFIE